MTTAAHLGIIVLALLLSGGAGVPLVGLLLRAALKETGTPGPTPQSELPQPELLRGGTWIGVLERLAVTAAVLAGQYALIAVVVAVKGFGRFDQLRGNPAASEKFVVGTLASLLWAAAIGAGAAWWIGLL